MSQTQNMSSNFSQTFNDFFDKFSVNVLTSSNVFSYVLIFGWIDFIWHLYLSGRQYKIYKSVWEVSTELIQVIDRDILLKGRNYSIDKTRFGFFASFWRQLLTTIILWIELIPLLWRYSESLIQWTGLESNSEIPQTLVFVVTGSLIMTILDLPLSLYSTFVIEQRHGFNKQTAGFYAIDKIKKFVIMQTIIAPFISGLIWIVQNGGQYFFIYLWAFCLLMAMIFITVFNDLIAPLFDKFSPLPEEDLRNQIENMAKTIGFPLKNVFVVEGSKRSSHSNAYFFGFYKNKRIVIFDTLFEDFYKRQKTEEQTNGSEGKSRQTVHKRVGCNNDEILAILAHELGHWQLNHNFKYVFVGQLALFLYFLDFALLYKSQVIYTAFDFRNNRPVFIGFYLIFKYILSPFNELFSFMVCCLSRHFESGADKFAKQLNRAADARSALIKLNKDNLVFPLYDWLYSNWYHTHPPLLERIRAFGKID